MIKIPESSEPVWPVVKELVEEVNANKKYEWIVEELLDQVALLVRQTEELRDRVTDLEEAIDVMQGSGK